MKYLLLLLLTLLTLDANSINEEKLKKQIGRMLVVGFENKRIDANSKIVKQIEKYDLGGVILFDRFYKDRSKTKNISSPKQLQELTSKLKYFSKKPLLISIDQEGGKVARLKPAYGFEKIPSAKELSEMPLSDAKKIFKSQAKMIKKNGINCDFAPVVDLAINPNNKVIVGLERSYGSSSEEVTKYAKLFMDSL
ncbi:MAG: hypothetical protein GQ474_06890, partial [Sulfurimonas sp.]|nr:hypothetical protein [Sulfurimonas sp.]